MITNAQPRLFAGERRYEVSGEKFIFNEISKHKLKFPHKKVLFSLIRNLSVDGILAKAVGKHLPSPTSNSYPPVIRL